MVEPDDFGLSPIETLAHVGDSARSPRHARVWKGWSVAVDAAPARLVPAREADPADPGADTHFESVRHTRIGCRLLTPSGQARAGVVVLHGYSDVPSLEEQASRWEPLRARGAGVLLLRVRGYPGSRLDAGDWSNYPGGWITRGLGTAPADGVPEWSFALGAADVAAGARALRRYLGGATPLFFAGESFGGALAVIAASYLAEREEVARLAIGMPSMGDWSWRLLHARTAGRGAGAEIARFLAGPGCCREDAFTALRVFDAAIHARHVRCPVLCKLATRDDVVPAPAAAAVFNALAGDPGRKWRYVTRYGHFDGGIADARRHAQFASLVEEFLDPGRDPTESLSGAA